MSKAVSLVPVGGVVPCQPWPHELCHGDWREQLKRFTQERSVIVVGERRFADQLGDDALLVDGGEAGKSVDGLGTLVARLVAAGVTRAHCVVAVGGGATTDLVGLAAATTLRGLDWIAVPTTVLAVTDASIGGKTAVNLVSGKNLLGAFHQPLYAIIDEKFWQTLPEAEWRSGVAEIVKAALLRPALMESLRDCDSTQQAAQLAQQAAALKLDVVAADPKERGLRRCLNLGHTLGHALETLGRGRLRHGEAVAIGLVAVLRLGHPQCDAMIRLMQRFGLPTQLPDWADREALIALMKRDKKASASGLRIVVPRGRGACELWQAFEPADLLA
jgi:3-dehydroquinate synthase